MGHEAFDLFFSGQLNDTACALLRNSRQRLVRFVEVGLCQRHIRLMGLHDEGFILLNLLRRFGFATLFSLGRAHGAFDLAQAVFELTPVTHAQLITPACRQGDGRLSKFAMNLAFLVS